MGISAFPQAFLKFCYRTVLALHLPHRLILCVGKIVVLRPSAQGDSNVTVNLWTWHKQSEQVGPHQVLIALALADQV